MRFFCRFFGIFFLKILLIYLRESARAQAGGREEQAPRGAGSLMWGPIPKPWDHDLNYPGAPPLYFFKLTTATKSPVLATSYSKSYNGFPSNSKHNS